MKLYAQFKRKDGTAILGSDGYIPLDARKAWTTNMHEAKEHAKKLNKHMNKGIASVELHRGDFRSSHCIAKSDL